MAYIKQALYFVLGTVLVTLVFYAGVTTWSAIFLDPNGSYFDQEPGLADAIMVAWLACMIVGGLVGAWFGRSKRQPFIQDPLSEVRQLTDIPEVFVCSETKDESCKETGNTSACHPNPSVRVDFCDVNGREVGHVSYVKGVTRNCVYIFQIETKPELQRKRWGTAMLRYVWNQENHLPLVPVDKRHSDGAEGFWMAAELGRLGVQVLEGVSSQQFNDEKCNP